MNVKKRLSMSFFLLLTFISLSVFNSCSNYKPFDEGELADEVINSSLWTSELPYKGGEKLNIELIRDDVLLITESDDGYHITKLNKNSILFPPKYLKLEYGNYYDWYRNNQLLVFGDKKDKKYISLIDYEDLNLHYIQNINIGKSSDTNIPGQKIIENKILFYNSGFNIDKYRYSYTVGNTRYTYTVPYIKSVNYSFNLLSIDNGEVKTYEDISEKSLGDLSGICEETLSKAKSTAVSKSITVEGLEGFDKFMIEYKVQDYLYYIEKAFIVNNGKTLVFTLVNYSEWGKHYSMDFDEGISSIQQYTARELAEMYPNELVVKDAKPKKETEKDKDIVISGKSYKLDDMAIFSDGFILAVRESDKETKYSQVLSVDLNMEKMWSYQVEIPYRIGNLLSDHKNNVVYFPDLSHEKKYVLRGLKTQNGEILSTLPANFIIQKIKGNSYILITGTEIDFKNEKIYIHDKKNNRIICTQFPRQNDAYSKHN